MENTAVLPGVVQRQHRESRIPVGEPLAAGELHSAGGLERVCPLPLADAGRPACALPAALCEEGGDFEREAAAAGAGAGVVDLDVCDGKADGYVNTLSNVSR